jgi:hypothetical protein
VTCAYLNGIGPNPSAIERLLAARTMICWLDTQICHHSAVHLEDSLHFTPAEKGHYQKSHDRAHRRFVACPKTLALVRNKALPAIRMQVAVRGENGTTAAACVEVDGSRGIDDDQGDRESIEG